MFTTSGRGPGNFCASGLYKKPVMSRSSNVFQLASVGSTNRAAGIPPVSLVVQRVAVEPDALLKMSVGDRAPATLNASCFESRCQRTPLITTLANAGSRTGSACGVAVILPSRIPTSMTCSVLLPLSFNA